MMRYLGVFLCFFVLAVPVQAQQRKLTRVTADQTETAHTITLHFADGKTLQIAVLSEEGFATAAALVAGLAVKPAGVRPPAAAGHAGAPEAEPLDNAKGAVAAILADNGSAVGAATLVARGKLLTTLPLGESRKVRLRFPGGAALTADVAARDGEITMLSLLAADSGNREPMKQGTAKADEEVTLVFSPYAGDVASQSSKIVAGSFTVKGAKGMRKLSAKVPVTNAGSPVVNARGELVALACSWIDVDESYAMPIGLAAGLLKE